ncbi:MAG: cardiolipin synthase [Eubacteriales bacterium]|nr:cardiolipin synthase [Eubacteriales bacterium]
MSDQIPQYILEHYIGVIYVINFIIAFGIVFLERKEPAATLVWISILFILPLVGLIFYILFSQNISKQKIFKMSTDEEMLLDKTLALQVEEMKTGKYPHFKPETYTWRDMIKLCQTYARAYYTHDNDIKTITDGNDMFKSMMDDIKNAKESINIQFFIVKKDEVGKELIKILTEKAKQGVEVRFLMDALGSREILERNLNGLKAAGGKYAFFFNTRMRLINIKLNYRNHRKLAVIDGRIGYIGGFNVGREYLGRKKKFGYWRDTHLRITGGSVRDINTRFILDWRSASKEDLPFPKDQYYRERKEKLASTGVQIVSSGPDTTKEQVKRGYMKMITSAMKNVYMQTPYFVPDKSILESLKMAAQSGVDVRVMIPCKPDHMFVYWATYAYVADLMYSGCKIFIYNNGFLHSKAMTVDEQIATVGSANFDIRSFKLNFEANAFIYDSRVTRDLEKIFEEDMKYCHQLTPEIYEKRGLIIKCKESVSRLLTELL